MTDFQLPQVDENYGIDWDGPPSHDNDGVQNPEVALPRQITKEELGSLPFSEAIDTYYNTITKIHQLLDIL